MKSKSQYFLLLYIVFIISIFFYPRGVQEWLTLPADCLASWKVHPISAFFALSRFSASCHQSHPGTLSPRCRSRGPAMVDELGPFCSKMLDVAFGKNHSNIYLPGDDDSRKSPTERLRSFLDEDMKRRLRADNGILAFVAAKCRCSHRTCRTLHF